MAFLKRDFIHRDYTPARKRERSLNTFHDAEGRIVAAYSYNTALLVVLPDADQLGGRRAYINRTVYSKMSTEHLWDALTRLTRDYPGLEAFAGDSHTVPVGTSADQLAALCGRDMLPWYVRNRPVAGHVHLTMADKRRVVGRESLYAVDDGDYIAVTFRTRDGGIHQVQLDESGPDISPNPEDDDYTLSPDLYTWLVTLRGKAMATAAARGNVNRNNGYGAYVDLTYSKRSA